MSGKLIAYIPTIDVASEVGGQIGFGIEEAAVIRVEDRATARRTRKG